MSRSSIDNANSGSAILCGTVEGLGLQDHAPAAWAERDSLMKGGE